jgi:hypothetical protein
MTLHVGSGPCPTILSAEQVCFYHGRNEYREDTDDGATGMRARG